MQRPIRSKLYQIMTWLYSVWILPAHKETTIQSFSLTSQYFEVYKKPSNVNNVLEDTLSLFQSLPIYLIFIPSGSALSSACKFTWPDIFDNAL